MNRIELLQGLIDKHGYKSYLEIGVNTPAQPGYSHDSIRVDIKHGVDPNVDTTFRTTSDDFFESNGWASIDKYDLIFIDGDHTYEQAYRDIRNSILRLNEGGTIVVHDCLPTSRLTQLVPRQSDAWHGDVWKAIVQVRLDGDVTVEVIDTDEGCAIIRPIPSDPWEMFRDSRDSLMNVITVEQWKERQ